MSDLKPCPFCGKDPNQTTAELGDRPCFYYECENPKCRATEMGWHNTEQEAINAWNTRPIEDALRKEIAKLQADNLSLVEQMNQMALKPNQEVVTWHEYPEEKPDIFAMCILQFEDSDMVVDEYDGFGFSDICKVIAWAYLPKGAKQ